MKHLKWIGCLLFLTLSLSPIYSGEDFSVLLEKAIYTEETLGDLNGAAAIYRQILADSQAGRDVAAEALFRLGMCHQKSGRIEEAKAAFKKLAELYPEQQELIAQSKSLGSAEPELQAAPWADGEVLEFAMKTKGSGPGLGMSMVTRVNALTREGMAGWKLRSFQGVMTMSQNASVWFDGLKYSPGYSRLNTRMSGQDVKATYRTDRIEVKSASVGQSSEKQVPLSRTVFDSVEIPHILRCLPLELGYKAVLPVFDSSNASFFEASIEVVAREELTVPAGAFDCFKIVLTHGTTNKKQTYWLSADSHLYVVKAVYSEALDMELNSISVENRNQPVLFEDSEAGFSVSVPPLWRVQPSMKIAEQQILGIFDPDGESSNQMIVAKVELPPESTVEKYVETVIDTLIKTSSSQYKEYRVRPENREFTTPAGRIVRRVIADLKGLITGKDSVQALYTVAKGNRLCQFVFETDLDKFEEMQPQFESIVESLHF